MKLSRNARRGSSALLIVLGATLMFLAPENAWIGIALVVLGAVIEIIAFSLSRYRK